MLDINQTAATSTWYYAPSLWVKGQYTNQVRKRPGVQHVGCMMLAPVKVCFAVCLSPLYPWAPTAQITGESWSTAVNTNHLVKV